MGLTFYPGYLDAVIRQYDTFGMNQFLKDLPTRNKYDKQISKEKCLSLLRNVDGFKNDNNHAIFKHAIINVEGVSWIKTEDIIKSVDTNINFHNVTRESSFKLNGSDEEKSLILKHLLESHPDTTLWVLWLSPMKIRIDEINKEITYDQPFCLFSTDDANLYKTYYVDLFE